MAQTSAHQYKVITANVQVVTGSNRVLRSAILNPGSAAATLTIYDGTSNAGPKLAALVSAANGYSVVTPELNLPTATGIYVEISGTGASGYVYFE